MTDLFSYCYVLRYYCLIYVSILSTNDSCIFFKTVCVSAQSSVPSLSLCPHADLEHRSQYRPILITVLILCAVAHFQLPHRTNFLIQQHRENVLTHNNLTLKPRLYRNSRYNLGHNHGQRSNPNVSNLSLYVSCFEIYGGKLFDLLNEHSTVKCMEDAKQHVQLLGTVLTVRFAFVH